MTRFWPGACRMPMRSCCFATGRRWPPLWPPGCRAVPGW